MKSLDYFDTFTSLDTLITLGKYATFGFAAASAILDICESVSPVPFNVTLYIKIPVSVLFLGVGAVAAVHKKEQAIQKEFKAVQIKNLRLKQLAKIENDAKYIKRKVNALGENQTINETPDLVSVISKIALSTNAILNSLKHHVDAHPTNASDIKINIPNEKTQLIPPSVKPSLYTPVGSPSAEETEQMLEESSMPTYGS